MYELGLTVAELLQRLGFGLDGLAICHCVLAMSMARLASPCLSTVYWEVLSWG